MDDFSELLTQIDRVINDLTLDQLRSLHEKITVAIANHHENADDPLLRPGRELVQRQQSGRITYQLEKVRCGKPACRCAQENGELHGPYWYRYRWNGKKVVSEYVGKKLPDNLNHR